MGKTIAEDTVIIPKEEYRFLKELYKTVKRQQFLLRINEAEKNLEIFKEDVFDNRLKTHKLKGELKNYYAFSIRYSDRIIFKILKDEGIYSFEIGSHDVCY